MSTSIKSKDLFLRYEAACTLNHHQGLNCRLLRKGYYRIKEVNLDKSGYRPDILAVANWKEFKTDDFQEDIDFVVRLNPLVNKDSRSYQKELYFYGINGSTPEQNIGAFRLLIDKVLHIESFSEVIKEFNGRKTKSYAIRYHISE